MQNLAGCSARALELVLEANSGNLAALKSLRTELARRRTRHARALERKVTAQIAQLEARDNAAKSCKSQKTIEVFAGVLSHDVVTISGELRLAPDGTGQRSLHWKLRAMRPDGQVLEKSEQHERRDARALLIDLRGFLQAANVQVPLSIVVSKVAEHDSLYAEQLESAIASAGLSANEPFPRKGATAQRPWWLFPQETLTDLTADE